MALSNRKPWGNEYCLYQNKDLAIWKLTINPGQCTSLHSHPQKKTNLLVLDGAAEVSFLSGLHRLFPGEKIQIFAGSFHRTTNKLSTKLELLEIEAPNIKSDLVRIKDDYGRPKYYTDEEKIEIEESFTLGETTQKIGSCFLQIVDVGEIREGYYCFLSGGIFHEETPIVKVGDVISKDNLERLMLSFRLDPSKAINIRALA
ncbi:MAG: hypothetical protein ACHQ1D_01530 [Nitrososphaerales archaeon]